MQKLGYVVSQSKIRDVADFIEVTNDIEKIKSDKPTMVVGLELARKNVENFSIIRKTFKSNKFWTFGKTERRADFEKDMHNFCNYVIKSAIDGIKYYYVDVITISKQKIKNLLKILSSSDDKYIYISKEMLYIYHKTYVLGISLSVLHYCGINTAKRLKKLTLNKHNKIFYNDSSISPYIKQYAKNKRYIIPYFLSLANQN